MKVTEQDIKNQSRVSEILKLPFILKCVLGRFAFKNSKPPNLYTEHITRAKIPRYIKTNCIASEYTMARKPPKKE